MIKVQVKERFHLDRFDELENIQRYDKNKNKEGYLYEKDTFECTEEMVEYLTKKNKNGKAYVKVIEKEKVEEAPKRTRRKRRTM